MKKVLTLMAVMLCAGALYAAEKPSIGVADFKNDTSAAWWYGGAGHDLAGMLSNELQATGKFRMVERETLGPGLEERDRAASGRGSKSTAAKVGKLTGAKYLVMGTVTAYEEKTAGDHGGISFGGISLGGKKDDAYIAVDVRVVDTTTGEIAYSRSIEARVGDLALGRAA